MKNIRLGMSRDDARLKALRSFGPMEKHKEETRDARGNRGEPDRVSTGVVSHDFFDLLGIKPIQAGVLVTESTLLAVADSGATRDHRRSVDRVARGVSSAAGLFCTVYEVSCGKPVIE